MADFSPSLNHLDKLDAQFNPSLQHLDKLDNNNKYDELTGLSGVGSDVIDLLTKIPEIATSTPEKLSESGKYIEKNPGKSMAHNLGQFAAGTGELGKSFLNSPADITDYLVKKKLHPAQLLSGIERPEEDKVIKSTEDIGKNLSKDFGSVFHKQLAEQLIKGIQNILPRIPEDTGIQSALGLNPKEGTGDEVFRNLPVIGSLGEGAYSLGKAAIKGGKNVNKFLNKPAAELKSVQDAENSLKTALEEAKNKTYESQLDSAEKLSDQKTNLAETHQEKLDEAKSLLPNEPESIIKSQTVEHFSQVRDQLKNYFDEQYATYREGAGRNQIREPLSPQDIESSFQALNPAGKRMAEGMIPSELELNIIDPETKKPFVIKMPAENATVQDYIEMMRTARDARSKLNRDMSKPHITRADELEMSRESQALEHLQDTVTKKIKQSVTPEEWNQFNSIQRDYKDLYRPFMDNNQIFDAWFNKKDNGGIFNELKQPAYSRLFNSLRADSNFNKLALSSALRGKIHPLEESNPVAQSKKINQLLAPHNADVTQFMTPEQFSSLKVLAKIGDLIGDTDKGLSALTKSMLSKATKALELSKAGKSNPGVKSTLENVASNQLAQRELNKSVKEANIKTSEAQSKADERKNANQFLKKALSISGIHKILSGL